MACIGCGRGFHWECQDVRQDNPCCCNSASNNNPPSAVDQSSSQEKNGHDREASRRTSSADTGDGQSNSHKFLKPDEEIGVSAGRKRAAVLYPINPEEACEWRQLANCGGGLYPIIGCLTGKQEHRHHGPDKDTSNNAKNNVHLICTVCHNTWHAKNDPHYDRNSQVDREIYQALPHSPRPATPEEMLLGNKVVSNETKVVLETKKE